jgi:hypothetical protein
MSRPIVPSPTARCRCCRRTLPRIDLAGTVCHTCLARCTWGSCAVRAALGLPQGIARKGSR